MQANLFIYFLSFIVKSFSLRMNRCFVRFHSIKSRAVLNRKFDKVHISVTGNSQMYVFGNQKAQEIDTMTTSTA